MIWRVFPYFWKHPYILIAFQSLPQKYHTKILTQVSCLTSHVRGWNWWKVAANPKAKLHENQGLVRKTYGKMADSSYHPSMIPIKKMMMVMVMVMVMMMMMMMMVMVMMMMMMMIILRLFQHTPSYSTPQAIPRQRQL